MDCSSESGNSSSEDNNFALENSGVRLSMEGPVREKNEYKITLATDLFGCAGTAVHCLTLLREKEGNWTQTKA